MIGQTEEIDGKTENVAALLAILVLGDRDARADKGMLAADFRQKLAAFEPGEQPEGVRSAS